MSSSTTITAPGDSPSMPRRAEGPLRPGELVGRYVVLSQVGAGGMGVVYAAYDPELDRKVAVKLLHADEPTEVRIRRQQRLLREAQAMARLDHPNVVTVHDVGSHGDRVYIAMEFVEGRTLADWQRNRSPSWRTIVDVFVGAGRGLAAAHDCGLVHRDFKPDNVMVGVESARGGGPRVRVMDFGLAHASPSSGDVSIANVGRPALDVTHRALAGTPAYMAPETIRCAPVDAAADQFSFCVALWELLYGRHPFGGDTPVELAGNVTAGRLRSPPSGRRVPRWLRRVCSRGLSAEPGQRFANMHELVAVLERGHARAWRIRALAVLAMAAVVAAGVVWMQQARHARAVAGCEAEGETIAEVWNETARDELRAGVLASGVADAQVYVDRVLPWLEAQAKGWAGARTQACNLVRDDPDWDAERADRSLWCLDERKRQFEALVTTLARGTEIAVLQSVQAAATLTPVAPCLDADATGRMPAPAASERDDVAAVQQELFLAGALYGTGAVNEALPVARAALARAEEIDWTPLTAASRMRIGSILVETGDYSGAERFLEDAYFEALDADAVDLAVDAARSLVFTVGYRLSRPDEAMRWWKQGEALDRELPDPSGVRRGRSLATLASLHRVRGEYALAHDVGSRAVQLLEAALGPEHPEVAIALAGVANSYRNVGKLAEAREAHERVVAILETALGPEHPDVASALDNLGGVAHALDEIDEAIALRERALAIRERTLGPDHPDVGITLSHLAGAYEAKGDLARALATAKRALAIQEKALGPDDLDIARALVNLAAIHRAEQDDAAARPLLDRALAIAEHKLGPDHPELAFPLVALAEVRLRQGERGPARTMFERALGLLDRAGAETGLLADTLLPLAEIALAEGRPADTIAFTKRILDLETNGVVPATRLEAARALLAQARATEPSDRP